ncbi:MAG: hypothetical protein QXU18_02160 [Thermoplasmatales archaeon]
MIIGNLRRGRVIIEDASNASTLRNKGYVGRNLGEKLSLNLETSLDLMMRKKIKVSKGSRVLSVSQVEAMMSNEEKKRAIAYHFLRAKGLKPVIRNASFSASGKKVIVFGDDEVIDFNAINTRPFLLAIVDSEGSCLLYSVSMLRMGGRSRRGKEVDDANPRAESLQDMLRGKGMKVASGFKFGAEIRIYEGSSPHAKYLMNLGDKSIARDLVARVRIAQSVRKLFVQGVFDYRRKKFNFLEIRWIRL